MENDQATDERAERVGAVMVNVMDAAPAAGLAPDLGEFARTGAHGFRRRKRH